MLLKLSEEKIYDTATGIIYRKLSSGAVCIDIPSEEASATQKGAEAESLWVQLLALCGQKAGNAPQLSDAKVDELLERLSLIGYSSGPQFGLPMGHEMLLDEMRAAVRQFLAKQAQ